MSWHKVGVVLLLGYLAMGRSFAYIGVAPLKLFIGEIALGAFLVMRPTSVFGRWGSALIHAQPFSGVAWAMYAFLCYGIIEVLRGFSAGYDIFTTIQGLAFNYYLLFIFLGVWVATQRPGILPRAIRWLGWWNGLYGTAYILGLSRLGMTMPGFPGVNLFGQPTGSMPVLLGLLCFESSLLRVWPLMVLNFFVLIGVQVRGDWLGFGVGLLLWGIVTRRFSRLLQICGGGAVLLTFAFLIDFSLPSPAGRGGEISVRGTFARIIAPLYPDLARQYSDTSAAFAGSVSWRTDWWNAIWDSVHSNVPTFLFGHGYGFPLPDLVPYLAGDRSIRSPHNVFYYALGYGGWISVVLFFLVHISLVQLLWRSYTVSGQSFGLTYWGAALAAAFFGNFFETPFGAIPFYLLVGMAAAPALARSTGGWPRSGVNAVTPTRRPARIAPRRRVASQAPLVRRATSRTKPGNIPALPR